MPKHIVRLVVLVLGFIAAAVAARALFTDDSFYRFGHYRGDSVVEIAALEPVYQAPGSCASCHAERAMQWSAQSHKTVACQVCHGPAKGHPAKGKLPVPSDTHKLCSLCHEAMPGRPQSHPQIEVAAHSLGESCVMCHNAHAPRIVAVAAVVADGRAGRQKAASCAGCHGEHGISGNETWPSLAGQNAVYLARILAAYKSGAQPDVVMTPIAKELSDAEVQGLAAFYAGLACAPGERITDVSAAAAGQSLHRKNCASCHGEAGTSGNPAWPSLAGQKRGYVVNALKAFRAGLRKDPMMAGVARGLSDADIANLAAYYAGQDCKPPRQARRTP